MAQGRQSNPGAAGPCVLRFMAAATVLVLLVGCSAEVSRPVRVVNIADPVDNFLGGVTADEPRAALAGMEMLKRGGSAADAATATFFMLAATYPVAVSPAAHGRCVVFDPAAKQTHLLDFGYRPDAQGRFALPLAARAFGLLQGRFGKLRWEQTLAGAEVAARFGAPASRAYARALAATPADQRSDPGLAQLVVGGIGRTLEEGQMLRQPELAAFLLRLRVAGVGDMYQGLAARLLAEDAEQLGVRPEEVTSALRAAVPGWSAPQAVVNVGRLSLALTPGQGADLFARAWQALDVSVGWSLFGSEAAAPWGKLPSALAMFPAGVSAEGATSGSTGFAVFDKQGQAVACTASLGRPFGTGRPGRQTGVLMAAPPLPGNGFDTAVLAVNPAQGFTHVGATATGGPRGVAGLLQAVMAAITAQTPAPAAVATPRAYPGASGALSVEPNLPEDIRRRIGVPLAEGPTAAGLVNMLGCNALPNTPLSCRFAADARGFGLAVGDTVIDDTPYARPCDDRGGAANACQGVPATPLIR